MKKQVLKYFDLINFVLLIIFICLPILILLISQYGLRLGSLLWKESYFILGFLGLLMFAIKVIINKKEILNNKNKKSYFILLLLIIVLIFASCLNSSIPSISFLGDTYRTTGFITIIMFIGMFFLFYYLDEDKKSNILNIFIIVSLVLSIYSLITKNYNAAFLNINHFAYYLIMPIIISLLLFINNNKIIMKIIYALSYTVLLYTLIQNNTFGCFLAIIFTSFIIMIYYFIKKKKTRISLGIVLTIMFCMGLLNQSIIKDNFSGLFNDTRNIIEVYNEKQTLDDQRIAKSGNRLELWTYGARFIKEKPILGYGLDNLTTSYFSHNINEDLPHNELIQIGAMCGLPVLVLYIMLICLIIINNKKSYKNLINQISLFVIICYIVSSMFGNLLIYTYPYFLMFLAFTFEKNKKDN